MLLDLQQKSGQLDKSHAATIWLNNSVSICSNVLSLKIECILFWSYQVYIQWNTDNLASKQIRCLWLCSHSTFKLLKSDLTTASFQQQPFSANTLFCHYISLLRMWVKDEFRILWTSIRMEYKLYCNVVRLSYHILCRDSVVTGNQSSPHWTVNDLSVEQGYDYC